MATSQQMGLMEASVLDHLALLDVGNARQEENEISGTPIFTRATLEHSSQLFHQYGFWAGMSERLEAAGHLVGGSSGGGGSVELPLETPAMDPRLFFNIGVPSSAFICGSQGSGKSHTLSCLLENCLMKSEVSQLDSPLVCSLVPRH
jgi:hypothetical protein